MAYTNREVFLHEYCVEESEHLEGTQVNDHDMGDSEVEKIIQAILFDVPLPVLLQAERYAVYRMLAYMLLNHKSCELEQTLFEVCACYFPIDFNPPPNDTGKISREDLADALLWCMTASAGFGKYCIPLAIEKLGSDLTVAKLDSLKLLELTVLFKNIWKDLQQGEVPGMGKVLEAFSSSSAEACSVALLIALPDIIHLLSQNEANSSLLLLRSVVCHIPPEALGTSQKFLQLLILFHCEGTTEHVPQCLAGFLNKLPDADLEEALECVWAWLTPEWTVAKTELLLWVIKALLLRGYPDLVPYTMLLKELLNDERLGRHVAEGFQQILQPSKVRQSALKCLLRIPTTDDDKFLPYRQQVVQGLTQCLADNKRIVRQIAARASSMW
ncbi:hypothetical protein HPB50_010987 [Hyalomma asiaticum]|uniref:Uncharacterized protein n=1 Tax=Hyalomma asiaticum TaxID=266040 RepID=A0ACB7TMC1_HYAAI|nr:hypothetical protein HPB50_010987 [Hyalomma asiaticum]